jgi:hypothetical protein
LKSEHFKGLLQSNQDFPKIHGYKIPCRGLRKRLDSDSILSQTIEECGNVYLPVLGVYGAYDAELILPEESPFNKFALKGNLSFSGLAPVRAVTTPYQELLERSRGLGHTNLSSNKASRGREPCIVSGLQKQCGHVSALAYFP